MFTVVYGVCLAGLLTATWIYYENGIYPRFLEWFHNMSHELSYNDENAMFVADGGELMLTYNGD